MKRKRIFLISYILLVFTVGIIAFQLSYMYNTKRFIENPELLGVPTIVITTRKPVFAISTPAPFVFDSGLGTPLAGGTRTYELGEIK
ncbi:hypothetical protein KAR91_65830 [Candidatus Pacearchaeota archaeon]|nr:hypothetical protein [Candidatus Pacearchaeota archaeon]